MPQSFYARDAVLVAPELLGKLLVRGPVVLRITEVEAYRHPGDTANHCRAGRTARNAPMWGPPGHAYVYLCYGLHSMLNLVTDREDEGAAVLIRAAEPVAGLSTIAARRGGKTGGGGRVAAGDPRCVIKPEVLTGPGKVGAALGLDTRFSGHPLYVPGGLEVRDGEPPAKILAGPRVGIDYASAADRRAPWRFAIADSPWVSHRRTLRKR